MHRACGTGLAVLSTINIELLFVDKDQPYCDQGTGMHSVKRNAARKHRHTPFQTDADAVRFFMVALAYCRAMTS